MIEAASLDISVDLSGFSEVLRRQGLPHRISEESGQQVIYVDSDAAATYVREALSQWQRSPELHAAATAPGGRARVGGRAMSARALVVLRTSPITLVLIGACLLVAAVSSLGGRADRVDFLFYPLLNSQNLLALLGDIGSLPEALRTLTPMLLHFGELHLIFNMLWLWYFGRQLETIQPGWVLLGLVILTSFTANTTQYLTVQYNNFGGMSGVVYGLVGYAWVIHNFMPRSHLMLNNSMFVFFVIALILMEMVAGSWIATAAHVGGLVSGLVLGLGVVLYYRLILKRSVVGRPDPGFVP